MQTFITDILTIDTIFFLSFLDIFPKSFFSKYNDLIAGYSGYSVVILCPKDDRGYPEDIIWIYKFPNIMRHP